MHTTPSTAAKWCWFLAQRMSDRMRQSIARAAILTKDQGSQLQALYKKLARSCQWAFPKSFSVPPSLQFPRLRAFAVLKERSSSPWHRKCRQSQDVTSIDCLSKPQPASFWVNWVKWLNSCNVHKGSEPHFVVNKSNTHCSQVSPWSRRCNSSGSKPALSKLQPGWSGRAQFRSAVTLKFLQFRTCSWKQIGFDFVRMSALIQYGTAQWNIHMATQN